MSSLPGQLELDFAAAAAPPVEAAWPAGSWTPLDVEALCRGAGMALTGGVWWWKGDSPLLRVEPHRAGHTPRTLEEAAEEVMRTASNRGSYGFAPEYVERMSGRWGQVAAGGPACRQCGHGRREHVTPDGRCLECDVGGGNTPLGEVCQGYVAPRQAAACMACGRRPPRVHVYVARWRDLPADTCKRGWLCVRSEGCQEVDRNRSDGSAKNSQVEGSRGSAGRSRIVSARLEVMRG